MKNLDLLFKRGDSENGFYLLRTVTQSASWLH